jgi:hypothetical protein
VVVGDKMSDNQRSKYCVCGSKLKCREFINGVEYVICVGIGCDRKWIPKRIEDKNLPLLKDVKEDWK